MKSMAVLPVSPALVPDAFCRCPKAFSFSGQTESSASPHSLHAPVLTIPLPQVDFPKLIHIFLTLEGPQDWRHSSSCGWKSWERGIMVFLDQVDYALVVAAFGSWHPSLLLGLTCCKCPPGSQIPDPRQCLYRCGPRQKFAKRCFLLSKVNTTLIS